MTITQLGNYQVKDESIKRTHLNVSTPSEAVVRKVTAGKYIRITQNGVKAKTDNQYSLEDTIDKLLFSNNSIASITSKLTAEKTICSRFCRRRSEFLFKRKVYFCTWD